MQQCSAISCHVMLCRFQENARLALSALALVRPELPAAVLLPTETAHSVGIDLFALLPVGVVVERQFGVGRDIVQRKEGQVVQPFVTVGPGDGEQLAVGVARVVHETRGGAKLLSIHNVDLVVVVEEV